MGLFYWGEQNNPRRRVPASPGRGEGRARCAGSRDMRRYFRAMVSRPADIPGLNMKRAWREGAHSGWHRMPVEWVSLGDVSATQKWISKDGLRHHVRPGARSDSGDIPHIISWRGHHWVFDGHHRTVCAIDRGETRIRARVWRPQIEK